MIRDAILPCAQKLTQVSLIYCTEPKNKKWEKEKLKTDMLRSIDKLSGNPWSQSSGRKRRLWWSCWSIAAAVACEFGQCHIVSVVGSWRETCCLWNDIFLPLLPLTQFHSCPTFFYVLWLLGIVISSISAFLLTLSPHVRCLLPLPFLHFFHFHSVFLSAAFIY